MMWLDFVLMGAAIVLNLFMVIHMISKKWLNPRPEPKKMFRFYGYAGPVKVPKTDLDQEKPKAQRAYIETTGETLWERDK